MKLSFVIVSFLVPFFTMASGAFADNTLPQCLGSQSSGCKTASPPSDAPFFRCSLYKSVMLCGDDQEMGDSDSCKVEDGETLCQLAKQDAPTVTSCADKIKQAIAQNLHLASSNLSSLTLLSDVTTDGKQVVHVDDQAASSGEDLYTEFDVQTSNYHAGDCSVGSVVNAGSFR